MLFSNKVAKKCENCQYSSKIDDDWITCPKKGIQAADSSCRFYEYDPCKRMPSKPKATDFAKYEEYDYSL